VTRQRQDRAARALGWRPSRRAPCPRTVAGLRCHALRYHAGAVDVPCPCQVHHHLLDHSRSWTRPDGGRVLTGEPYDLAPDELSALAADCTALGLDVAVTGRSPWNPGATVLIVISAHPDTDTEEG